MTSDTCDIEIINPHRRDSNLEKYFESNFSQIDIIDILSHEIRTPIQAILTYSELLQSSNQSQENYINAILRNALRLKILSSNLSNFARIDTDTLRLKKETFDFRLLVMTIVEDFRNIIRIHNKNNLKISLTFQEPIFIQADSQRLTQVILNLVDNAIKFTKTGSISIKIESSSDHVTCSVTDTGTGIDDKIMHCLFNKFITSSEHGTGLGLYICKKIIEAHKGKIWAESTESGTTITFLIPKHRNQHKGYTKFLTLE